MKKPFPSFSLLLIALSGLGGMARGQTHFEFGGLVAGSLYRDASVSSGSVSGSIGFKPGFAGGAFLGQSISDHFGGEIRYLYVQNELRLKSGGTETTFGGRAHLVHYDLMIYASGRQARTRLYVAGGGGLKYYQGTGTEQAFQPLSNLALLTKTNEALPTVDFGGGVKFHPSSHMNVRVEFRDYITKVPKVFAASPGASLKGIFHQWLPSFGIGWTF